MFKKIVVAYNDSHESERALRAAMQLAKSLSAELHTVTVVTGLPAYTAFHWGGGPLLTPSTSRRPDKLPRIPAHGKSDKISLNSCNERRTKSGPKRVTQMRRTLKRKGLKAVYSGSAKPSCVGSISTRTSKSFWRPLDFAQRYRV